MEEDADQKRSSENDEESRKQQPEVEVEDQQPQQRQLRLQPGTEEKLVLQFMDSMNNYLTLFDVLSSTLRQGWLELASARHSMGAFRINSSLLDLKPHSAATTLKITQHDGIQPCFKLRKWESSEVGNDTVEDDNMQQQDSTSICQSSVQETAEMTVSKNTSGPTDNGQVQKERSKSLSVFGVLISPKLRATQLSFEKALETLLEIANMRSSLLYSFNQLHQGIAHNEG